MRLVTKRNYREQSVIGYARKESDIIDNEINVEAALPLEVEGVAVRPKEKKDYEGETDDDESSISGSSVSVAGGDISWQDVEVRVLSILVNTHNTQTMSNEY